MDGFDHVANVLHGLEYKDGVLKMAAESKQPRIASSTTSGNISGRGITASLLRNGNYRTARLCVKLINEPLDVANTPLIRDNNHSTIIKLYLLGTLCKVPADICRIYRT